MVLIVDEYGNFQHNIEWWLLKLYHVEVECIVKGYGENIRKYRKQNKLTQEELGELLGVTKSFISKLETEYTKPSLEMLANIAGALKVDIGDILGSKQSPPPELKDVGVDWLILGEELEEQGITPEQVKQWAEIVKSYSQFKK
jgi:XRE family transcriptional regulator, master regulator for biofilm formation